MDEVNVGSLHGETERPYRVPHINELLSLHVNESAIWQQLTACV